MGGRLDGWGDGLVREVADQRGLGGGGKWILNSLAGPTEEHVVQNEWHLCPQMHISQMWNLGGLQKPPPWMGVAISWTRDHSEGSGAAVWVWGFWMEIRSEVIDVDARVVVDEFVACQRHLARSYKPKIRAAIWSFFSECLPRSPSLVDLSQCHSFSLTTKARSSLSSLPLLIIDSIGYF